MSVHLVSLIRARNHFLSSLCVYKAFKGQIKLFRVSIPGQEVGPIKFALHSEHTAGMDIML